MVRESENVLSARNYHREKGRANIVLLFRISSLTRHCTAGTFFSIEFNNLIQHKPETFANIGLANKVDGKKIAKNASLQD